MMRLSSKGYKVKDICDAFEVSRSAYYYHKKRGSSPSKKKRTVLDKKVLKEIEREKREHPLYGYRRVWAKIKNKFREPINHKRVYRLMKEENLLCKKKDYRAKRHKDGETSKPEAKYPNHWWGIDMTKHYVDGYGWLYIVPVLDWYTKELVGITISPDCKSKRWKAALEQGLRYACPEGSREYNLNLMSDNGSQPTSKAFENLCDKLEINHITTSYNNPKGNAETESFIKTLKEDCLWINEFKSFKEAKRKILEWIDYYNNEYPHSTIGYRSPREMRIEAEDEMEILTQNPEKCV